MPYPITPMRHLSSHRADGGTGRQVAVAVLPQDPLVNKDRAEIMLLPGGDVEIDGRYLRNRWFTTVNARNHAHIEPDPNGHLVFPAGSPEFDVVNTHVHATRTVEMFERWSSKPIRWRFGPNDPHSPIRINVNKHCRKGTSETYAKRRRVDLDVRFSPALGKEVRDSESAEAVSHEIGHYILSQFCPQVIGSRDLETRAFDEAFADMAAMLYTLEDPANGKLLLSQTRGDLTRQNLLAKFCEEDGKATALDEGVRNKPPYFIRSAINHHRYQDPKTLPKWEPGEGQYHALWREPHDFATIFTGAFYDLLVDGYERQTRNGTRPQEALRNIKEALGQVLTASVQDLPAPKITFRQAALAMLEAAGKLQSWLAAPMQRTFHERGILS